jgi:hypothetical protein
MNLPGYLKPQDGNFRIDDAETLWGLVHYGIAVGTPETPEVKRLRQRARQEVAAVVSKDPGPIRYESRPLARRPDEQAYDACFPLPPSLVRSRSVGYLIFPRTWVTVDGMAGLFRQHGHPYQWEPEAEPAQQPVAAGLPADPPPPSTNPKGGRPEVLRELAEDAFATNAELEAASPGKRVTNKEAILAVVDKHIPIPDPSAPYSQRTKAQQEREAMTKSLQDKMKPSRLSAYGNHTT